jgi:nucleotide-binding universal stress UspA family protein
MSKIARILVPVDFSDGSKAALAHALVFAKQFDGVVEAMHIWEPSPYLAPSQLIWLQGEPKAYADHIQEELAEQLDNVVKEVAGDDASRVEPTVRAGYASHNIIKALDEGDFDLVVMGTHGRTGLKHLLMGSVAERVVRMAPCPVLTVRIDEEG